ncbi:MAG: sensor histidine kinase [Acidimicrobiales bacterium]
MHHTTADLLLVEDDEVDAETVTRALARISSGEIRYHWVRTLAEALDHLSVHRPDIVLSDLSLPDAAGLTAVEEILAVAPDCSLVVQTHVDSSDDIPFRALRLGAQDYLCKKEISPSVLERTIRYSLVRSETRRQLAAAQAERDHADTELDDFAHVVAHDLRGPVRTARLFADRLLHQIGTRESELRLPAEADRLVDDFGRRLDDSLGRVDRMILSMLDYASLRQYSVCPTSVWVRLIVEDALAAVAADLDDAAATVRVVGDAWALVEPALLVRVLTNVIANATKYRRPDVPLEIDIEVSTHREVVRMTIADNGKGLPPGDAERAFRILERLDPTCSDGLGFGLAICRRILDAMGGSIRFRRQEAPGATVVIELVPGDRVPAPEATGLQQEPATAA